MGSLHAERVEDTAVNNEMDIVENYSNCIAHNALYSAHQIYKYCPVS